MGYVSNPMTIAANVRCRYRKAELPARTVEAGVAAFLDGKTNGEELLHALYDHVLNEPIPQSMREILKEQQFRTL
jgi:hypothetical protein